MDSIGILYSLLDGKITVNKYFEKWSPHIIENVRHRNPKCGFAYDNPPDNILLGLCEMHANVFSRYRYWVNDNIILVHPFYVFLTHYHLLEDKTKEEAKEYLETMLEFLQEANALANVILLDTIHHYAAVSSHLLELGLANYVIFTLYDDGRSLYPNSINILSGTRVFLAGGYNNRCLFSSIRDISEVQCDMFAIKGLVLNSPRDNLNTIIASSVVGIDQSRLITIEDVKKQIQAKVL
ncbi:MAG: hypothetical protein QXM68_03170 [Candidatus Aenigmatarchaeota archaeon]|nr:hypothetical protein [Candidatus Aenigmarchaeota archaeon]